MHQTQYHRRSAFTLVEVLVVIGIIGILMALLLPAVQAARETGRRMRCSNNLKQIGLALHNYHDTLGSFPPAMLNPNYEARWGWAVLILPYLEQQPLHDKLTPDGGRIPAPSPTNGLQTELPVYLCPSDEWASTNPVFRDYGKSNYALSGSIASGHNRTTKIRDIRDGTSCSILVGERDTVKNIGAIWPGFCPPTGSTINGLANRPINTSFQGDRSGNVHATDPRLTRFTYGSQHPGGANFVFCDGAVHFLSGTIESHPGIEYTGTNWLELRFPMHDCTYQKLFNIKDGKPVQIP